MQGETSVPFVGTSPPSRFHTLTPSGTMATHAAEMSPSLSDLSISNYNQSNSIDLTADDEDGDSSFNETRESKRMRLDQINPFDAYKGLAGNFLTQFPHSTPPPHGLTEQRTMQSVPPRQPYGAAAQRIDSAPVMHPHVNAYRPVFARPSATPIHQSPQSSTSLSSSRSSLHNLSENQLANRHVIDLTGSPSPPPLSLPPTLNPMPSDLPPKTPVCIGELTVTALVLYPVSYLRPVEHTTPDSEWAPIRLQYEHNANKPGGSETIHIKSPHSKGPLGDLILGEAFGVVEQKVATSLGPMLGKGLIRIDGKVRRGMPNVRLFSRPCCTRLTCASVAPDPATTHAIVHSQWEHPCCRRLPASMRSTSGTSITAI
jgi:SWI/SNF-related matrix-associated actin-dependent regulator of chromatin subfamily A3